jgi:predicted MFS family arabinose efflux permease
MKRTFGEAPAIVAMVLLTNPGGAIGSITPALVYDLTERFHFLPRQASAFISAELGGMTAAIVLSSLLVVRFDRHLLAGVAIIIAIIGQLATLAAPSFDFVFIARMAVGFGGGIAYSVAIAALAGTRQPDRNFGYAMASNMIAATLVLTLVAYFTLGVSTGRTIVALTFLLVLAGLGLPWLPRSANIVKKQLPKGSRPARYSLAAASIGLVGMFLISNSFGVVWPSVAQIALERGDAARTIAAAFAVTGFGGTAGAFSAASISRRLPRQFSMAIGALGFAIAVFALTLPVPFPLIAPAAMFFFIFGIPFYFGAMASLDPSGRLAVLTSAMLSGGITTGQLLTAAFMAQLGYCWIIATGVILSVAGLLALLGALRIQNDLGTAKQLP